MMEGMDMKMNGSGMHMSFYFGNDATILFAPWKTTTWHDMLWSCVVVLLVSFAYEGLKALRQRLIKCAKAKRSEESTNTEEETTDDVHILNLGPTRWTRNRRRVVLHLTQTLLHLIQLTIGYMLMLVAMTYNAWLFICVVLGATIGYLVFNLHDIYGEDLHDPCH